MSVSQHQIKYCPRLCGGPPRLLTGRVGGTEPEDRQVAAQVLDLVAEEGGVREGGVRRHPDQIVLELGRHHLVLLRERKEGERRLDSGGDISTKHLDAPGIISDSIMYLVTLPL